MSIELWAARLERPLTERETTAMLRLLPEARRERLLRIKQPEKRREPLCAYLILRHALWEQYRWRELPEIRLSSFGKPYFPEHPDVHFNLSHTAGAVLVGLSDRPVGVDIEHIRPVSQRTMRRLADVGTERAFFQSWVRREARTKRSEALTADEERWIRAYQTHPDYRAQKLIAEQLGQGNRGCKWRVRMMARRAYRRPMEAL